MVKFGKHVAIIPICLGSLAACAGVSEVVASPPSVASATIFFAPPALQTNRGARSELLRVGKRDAVREAYHSCEHTGGDWKLPTIGSRVKGTVQYGANDCKKGARISLTSYAVGPEGDCGPELGYTNSGAEIEFDAAGTLIFSGLQARLLLHLPTSTRKQRIHFSSSMHSMARRSFKHTLVHRKAGS